MNRFTLVAAMVVVVLLSTSPAVAQDFVPVTDDMLQNPDPADWLMWRRTLNSWGYSPLDQIDRDNVDQLRLVWTRGLSEGIQEGHTSGLRRGHVLPEPGRRDRGT